jgi:hypothetical protein
MVPLGTQRGNDRPAGDQRSVTSSTQTAGVSNTILTSVTW